MSLTGSNQNQPNVISSSVREERKVLPDRQLEPIIMPEITNKIRSIATRHFDSR